MLPITRKALLSLVALAAATLFASAPAAAQDDPAAAGDDAAATEGGEAAPDAVPAIAFSDAAIDAELAKLAEDAAKGDWKTRSAAVDTMAKQYGGRAVAALLRFAGSSADIDNRVQAVMALKRLGPDSIAALVAGLESRDATARRSLCQALGQIGARDAAAALRCVAEHDDDAVARSEAERALAAIAPGAGGSAAGALLTTAQEYLSGARPPIAGPDGKMRIYFWNGRRVMDREVNGALQSAAYAKLYAEAALKVDASNAGAQQTLVQAYSAMLGVIKGGGDDLGPAGWDTAVPHLENLLRLGGVIVDVPPVDAPAAETLNGASELLGAGDKRMRYKAALALAGSTPSEQVVATLGEALSESAKRQVLFVSNDPAELNVMIEASQSLKVVPVTASSGATGILRAKEPPVKDAIVLRSTLTDVLADRVVQVLSRDVRSAGVPVILVVDESERERLATAFGDKVVAVIPAPINPALLKPALDAAFEKAALNDERMEAEQFSRRSALALAAMDGSVLGPASGALVGAIDREDAVRIPSLVALSKVGDPAGEAPALALLQDSTASGPARVAAVYGLRGILGRNPGRPDTLHALESLARGNNATLRSAACAALGGATGLSPEARTALFMDLSLPY